METGLLDERDLMHQALKAAFKAFMDRITPEQRRQRRAAVLDQLKSRGNSPQLAEAKPIRVREDEMSWYLFLCEQAISDPMCTDESQSQRTLPFCAGLGARWQYVHRVTGIHRSPIT